MKFKTLFICILAVLFTANTWATDAPNFDITGIKVSAINRTLQVKVAKTTDEAVNISIETPNGTVIHQETAKQAVTLKQYDLQLLESGNYVLIVENGRTKTIQPFVLEFGHITVTEAERTTKRLPQITQIATGMDVRVYAPKKTAVTIKIADNQGLSVFEETVEALGFAKHYNLSKLSYGVYFVEVNADGETQYATVVVK
jgi:sRNA-binding carbon storage regulator CsrA